MKRVSLLLSVLTTVYIVTGCEDEPAQQLTAADPQSTSEMHGTMTQILEPPTDVIWGSAGYIITEEGEESLAPTTDEGWAEVRRNALILAESGDLLQSPALAVDQGAWIEYARALSRVSKSAITAAENKDADELFKVGGHIYNVCRACHQAYWHKGADSIQEMKRLYIHLGWVISGRSPLYRLRVVPYDW